MYEEIFYKKTQHGSFALFTSRFSIMIEINDLSSILNKLPYEIINYFTNLYGAEIIETRGYHYLYFKKEKQVKRAVEYINGAIIANKMIS